MKNIDRKITPKFWKMGEILFLLLFYFTQLKLYFTDLREQGMNSRQFLEPEKSPWKVKKISLDRDLNLDRLLGKILLPLGLVNTLPATNAQNCKRVEVKNSSILNHQSFKCRFPSNSAQFIPLYSNFSQLSCFFSFLYLDYVNNKPQLFCTLLRLKLHSKSHPYEAIDVKYQIQCELGNIFIWQLFWIIPTFLTETI